MLRLLIGRLWFRTERSFCTNYYPQWYGMVTKLIAIRRYHFQRLTRSIAQTSGGMTVSTYGRATATQNYPRCGGDMLALLLSCWLPIFLFFEVCSLRRTQDTRLQSIDRPRAGQNRLVGTARTWALHSQPPLPSTGQPRVLVRGVGREAMANSRVTTVTCRTARCRRLSWVRQSWTKNYATLQVVYIR